jgi:murein tripeptide amidase MpaA
MYVHISCLSLLLLINSYPSIYGDRSSPIRAEKDAAVYQLLENYHHYTELDRLLQQWTSNYSSISQVFSVGKSYMGRSLLTMRITSPIVSNITNDRDEYQLLKPKFKWVANMHGDETIGREMMLALIYHLLINSNSDRRIHSLLSSTDIYIMPSMNPVGRREKLAFINRNVFIR